MSNSEWHNDQTRGERVQRQWESELAQLRAQVTKLSLENLDLRANHLDAPGGPRCACGLPSTQQSGACDRCWRLSMAEASIERLRARVAAWEALADRGIDTPEAVLDLSRFANDQRERREKLTIRVAELEGALDTAVTDRNEALRERDEARAKAISLRADLELAHADTVRRAIVALQSRTDAAEARLAAVAEVEKELRRRAHDEHDCYREAADLLEAAMKGEP